MGRLVVTLEWAGNLRGFFSLSAFVIGDDRSGVLALFALVATDQLYDRQRCAVAITETGFHDAAVATVAILVALTEHLEQLCDLILVADL